MLPCFYFAVYRDWEVKTREQVKQIELITGGKVDFWSLEEPDSGLAGGLAPALGGGVSDALGLGLSQTGSATLGGAIVGAGAGYATTGTSKGALTGAAIGGASSGVGEGLAGMTGTGSALSTGLGQAARATGAGLTAGYNPKQSALMGLTSGLMSGYDYNGDNISQYQKALGQYRDWETDRNSVV